MSDIGAKVADLINFSSNQKPLEFEATFKELLQNKVADAIDNKKIEIANKMFNAPADEGEKEVEQETESDSEEETEEGSEEQKDGETA